MNAGDHDRIEELLSIRALGGLDPADEAVLDRLLSEHGASCEECGVLRDEYAEVAGRLAFALPPAEPREGLEDELVALATGAAAHGARAAALAARRTALPTPLDDRRPDARRRGDGRPWRALAAAAVAVVVFAAGWLARDVAESPGPTLADARVVTFHVPGGAGSPAGELAVAYRPGADGALLLGSGLPSPGRGRVLEVWLIRGDRVTRGACVQPADDGSLARFIDAGLGSTSTMAVTVESARCPSAPTTEPILTADLRASTA
jgi:hypothetical protein